MSTPSTPYDAAERDDTTLAQAQAMIDRRYALPLTGRVIDAGQSPQGTWVKLEVDGRWGFGEYHLGLDARALVPEPSAAATAYAEHVAQVHAAGRPHNDTACPSATRQICPFAEALLEEVTRG